MSGNFTFLERHDRQLTRLGGLAERFFAEDAGTCLIKLRQFAEVLAQLTAAHIGLWISPDESQADLLRRLRDRGVVTGQTAEFFHQLRKAGNAAAHDLAGDQRTALNGLKFARALGIWYHRVVTGERAFDPGPFIPPPDPRQENAALAAELDRLRRVLHDARSEAERAAALAQDAAQKRLSAEERARRAETDRAEWERLAEEVDADRVRLQTALSEAQAAAIARPPTAIEAVVTEAREAVQGIDLDEWATRQIIDEQLRAAGWEADSATLTWGNGIRPQKARNLAIAEWPTANGPADYVLFAGLTALAVVEAKPMRTDASAAIDQAGRYAEGYEVRAGEILPEGGPWDGCRVPFLFATNGRPFLRQLEQASGIWFHDVRHPGTLRHPLQGWYSPAGLVELLRQNPDVAHQRLRQDPIAFNFPLRDYQARAIRAVEEAIAAGRRTGLVAMATGTGKTKTCIGLVYRLLKAGRFRRILFLVDRNALGEQAAGAFKETRIENLQTFADIFGIKEPKDTAPDPDTRVQIATVQAMVKRLLYPDTDRPPPPVDQYDCIVVDECHRGYLLDREMGDDELRFADERDYISKYRRVLDRFDAVKIGLTATPALHTVDIFGEPTFRYTYAEAVIDGWLVDHEPPIRLHTALSEDGITWAEGEDAEALDTRTGQLDLIHMPDEVRFEVEDFNRRVITAEFNRVVAEWLAGHIDPSLPGKTLVFAASDRHADILVSALKTAFTARYGTIEDGAVTKITGSIDRPLAMIRRFKNEARPGVAVTVDLLTTGIDVPGIVNLVFVRRVNSRILYEQMIGRATRLCPDIGKTAFRIFDAVGLYEAMRHVSTMRPVVANPSVTLADLARDLMALYAAAPAPVPAGLAEEPAVFDPGPMASPEERDKAERGRWLLDQLLARLQRKRRRLSDAARQRFTAAAGMTPEDLARTLRAASPADAARLLAATPAMIDILERANDFDPIWLPISPHPDDFRREERGYGRGLTRPDDYLAAFESFLRANLNTVPALLVVACRPRDLTRATLREVRLLLENEQFGEPELRAAWRDTTNQDIAASIIGYIRRFALGDPLIPYDQRVDRAMSKVLASRAWTEPQRKWLDRIARQITAEVVVDRAVLDTGQFKAEAGGFARLNRIFDGRLEEILGEIGEGIWERVG